MGGAPAAAPPPPPAARPPDAAPQAAPAPAPAAPAPAPADAAPAPAPAAAPPPPGPAAAAASGLEQLTAHWTDAIVPEIGRRSVPLQSLMQHASPLALDDGEVVLAFPRSHQFALTTADSPPNREVLESVLGQAVGRSVRVRLEVAAAEGEADPGPVAEAAPSEPLDENDLLSELKEKFDAREIEERR